MIELITFLIAGLIIGIIAGIVPGLHPNTIMPLLIPLSLVIDPFPFAVMLVAMIISTNFFEFIKTTYLSCPDEGTSLSLRYAQKLLLQGRGAEAVKLLSIGALGSTLVIAMLLPLLLGLIPLIYEQVEGYIAITLILFSFHLILKEEANIGKAGMVFLLSAILGILVLRTEIINQPLLPLLTGFYGVSNMILNIQKQEDMPPQLRKVVTEVDKKTKARGVLKSVFSSSIITFIPAIGPSQASTLSNELVKTRNEKEKLITLGGVNTGDVLFSLTALFTINKARSGVIERISREVLTINNYLVLILISIATAVICYWLVNKSSYKISKNINKVNYTKLNTALIGFIITIVLILSGWVGLLVLTTATLIGLIANSYNVNQNHLMAALIVPTIIYYLG